MNRKIRVGLVYGGRSGEHDVSLQTALAVIQAFDHDKYEIHPFYITKQGEWRSGPALTGPAGNVGQLAFAEAAVGRETLAAGTGSALLPLFAGGQRSVEAVGESGSGSLDVIFPLLHGTFGEDGKIQGLFEMADLPYVGAGVLASAVGMDKVFMKKVFAAERLPQCLYRYITRPQWEKDQAYFLMEIEVALAYPCFVKPANLGSSVGITKARNREELIEAVEFAFRFDRKVIVEEQVNGREIEVAVLGNDDPKASVAGEIVASSEFYDYNAKYIDGKSAMIIPADIPEDVAQQARELAVRAFRAVDGSGLARVDFFYGREDGVLYLNEINTMPGFTPYSMYPMLWRETGLSYRQLLDELIQLAIERHEDKSRIQYTLD